ncbi:hypothetical protein TNCV_1764451 [Trichonephila clavipes]|nr:hypothetical protein TNCV_1764451 [Trichonephila clavipes]
MPCCCLQEEEFLGVPLTPPKRVTPFPRLEEGNVPINTSWFGLFWEFPAFWGNHGPREDIPPLTPDQSEKLIVFRKESSPEYRSRKSPTSRDDENDGLKAVLQPPFSITFIVFVKKHQNSEHRT